MRVAGVAMIAANANLSPDLVEAWQVYDPNPTELNGKWAEFNIVFKRVL